MSNKITEKYFTQSDFSEREVEVLAVATAETGFVVEKEIFRGMIYDQNKVGSLIYKGKLGDKSAVLKLQGLKPEVDEVDIIQHLNKQNQSKFVRLPIIYSHKPWNQESQYGYTISEYIDAPKIFEMPFASKEEMKNFAYFYQEYCKSGLTKPWFEPETTDSLVFTKHRVDNWRKISEHKKRLVAGDYLPYLEKYYALAEKHLPSVPMVFCHGHLTANDIYCLPDNSFVLLSNLFWSYRPKWYDLTFNIWSCTINIRDTSYTFEQLLEYIEKWLAIYCSIPSVQQDKDFERKINIILLERIIGAILVDLGANDFYEKEENNQYFRHLLKLHQQLFDHLAQKLENI